MAPRKLMFLLSGDSGARAVVHATVTQARVLALAEAEAYGPDPVNPGICLSCGAECDECEPDAAYYRCHECEMASVFGCAEILMRGLAHPDPFGGASPRTVH